MKFHYHWSIQSDIAKKEFEKTHSNILETPLYLRYCSKNKYVPCKEADKITIDGIKYTIIWWNNVGKRKCNAFCISIGDEKREYFYLRFKNNYKKYRWDWYNNDKSAYEKYSKGENMCVYKELEASFQGNIDENFPKSVFFKSEQLYGQHGHDKIHMFDVCILPKFKRTLEEETGEKVQQGYVLRFTFNQGKINRITNIEQLSIHKDQAPFPRNVRRLIDNKNTIYFYFQSTDEYIEEWKKRYKLSTDQQQKYFFSFILCICAVMKYIEYEFSHQMISFPYKKSFGNENNGIFSSCLDDSDVQRHRRDFELWNGFFIPPEHQFQTSQIDKNIEKNKKNNVKAWYKSLAIVEPLKKFIYERDKKNKKQQLLMDSKQNVFCSHIAGENDILWLSNSTQDVYCNRCGVLLQFSECIRKYVLETENNEVNDFLWPWYRNFFHRRDVKKYHTSVAKYNLTYLFRIEDVLNKSDNTKESDNNIIKCCFNKSDNKSDNKSEDENKYDDGYTSDMDDDNNNSISSDNMQQIGRTQIRHFRKFAAHILLGGWDILRNLNVIRNQLQCIFGYFDEDSNVWLEWTKWREFISKCNDKLRDDLSHSKARKLMELHHEDQLSMKNNEQTIFSNLIDTILTHARIYSDSKNTIIDGFKNDSLTDLKLDNESDSNSSGCDSIDDNDDKLKYYVAFKQSWRMIPDWWSYQHDKLLLELALKFNWDKDKYKSELTHPAKKQYYQVLLSSKNNDNSDDESKDLNDNKIVSEMSASWTDDLDEDDEYNNDSYDEHKDTIKYYDVEIEQEEEDEDYIGYQEFQVWCENWRNIQHRLRYVTFIICDYFYKCTPSMVGIRIPDDRHRIEQYKSKSIVFLNGYMEHVHLINCKEELIDLNNIQERNNQLRKIEQQLLHQSSNENVNGIGGFGRKHMTQLTPYTPLITPMNNQLLTKQSKSSRYSKVLKNAKAITIIHGNSSKRLTNKKSNKNHRIRDPFMKRDLDFELEQICQSFDLLEYGREIATFLIVLLKRKQLAALWSALGIVLEYMPYEYAREILEEYQEDLRHGEPQQLKNVCDRIRKGSNFSVHICLFLAEYMENNSKCDLARCTEWMKYSKSYEKSAGNKINTIESNHLLAVLLDIPLTYSGGSKVSLLQVALEQNRAEFLNNERINAVMAHVWQSPSGLAPNTEIIQANDSYFDIWYMLFDKPFHFYLTPMGFNATIKTLHLLYLLLIFIFIAQRQYLNNIPISVYEWFLWSLNIGYILYECIEAYDKGIRGYLNLAGWINYWDISICIIWIILFIIRIYTSLERVYTYYHQDHIVFQIYIMLWAIQTASLSARSLVLFQTSEYFGVLLRMLLQLMAEMMKFLFVLGLILVGFVFGLYYIQGGYDTQSFISLNEWYDGFKYLFQLTVGAGDFSEIEDITGDEIIAQIFVIGYLILAAILMMNLLIALLTTTYERIHISAKTASSFAFAESTYDLSHRSRFMPAPICIYIFFIAIIIHILNFIPSIIYPKYLNIYNCINHYQYQGFDKWRMTINGCLNCNKIYEYCCLCNNECKIRWIKKQDTLKRLQINSKKHKQFTTQIYFESFYKDEMKKKQKNQRFWLCCNCCNGCDCCNCCSSSDSSDHSSDMSQIIELKVGDGKNNNNNSNNNNNKDTIKKTYQLVTRGRVCKYCLTTFCGCFSYCCSDYSCCQKLETNYLKSHRYQIYHRGCYSCIPTSLGAKEKVKDRSSVNGITLNQYAELYEKYHQFNLDQADIVLLKHLTVDSLFCKICYRPFDPKSLDECLLSPFWALSEIISIYSFPFILYIPLFIIYGILTLIEMLQSCLNEERERENVDDYDRQYFAREALNIQSKEKYSSSRNDNNNNYHYLSDSSNDNVSD